MNDELQTQLAELLQKLLTTVEQGSAFAADQIPPLVAEKILLGRIETSLHFVAALVLFGIGVRLTIRVWRWAARAGYDDAIAAAVVGTVLALVPSVVMVVSTVTPCLTAWFAPRLYIVEWLRELL